MEYKSLKLTECENVPRNILTERIGVGGRCKFVDKSFKIFKVLVKFSQRERGARGRGKSNELCFIAIVDIVDIVIMIGVDLKLW